MSSKITQCKLNGCCPIEPNTKKCGFCRFNKCLVVGMNISMVVSEAKKLKKKLLDKPNEEEKKCDSSSYDNLANPLVSKCDHIWIKKTPGSNLVFQSFKSSCYLLYQYKIEIEVLVNQSTGIIVGTDLTLDSILFKEKSNRKYNMNRTNSLLIKGINEIIVFSRTQEPCNKPNHSFTVQVNFNSCFKTMRMEGMTESLWTCLQQAIGMSERIFQELVAVQHYLVNQTPSTHDSHDTNLIVNKKLVLVMDLNLKKKIAVSMFEDSLFVQSLPLEDQIILFKEMLSSSLIDLHTQERDTNSYSRTAVGNHLLFQWRLHYFKGMKDYEESFQILFDNTLDILRFDPFVITLLIIIYFFRNKPGLTFEIEIEAERLKYSKILDMYFKAKIKSGLWNSITYEEVWSNIHSIFKHINELNIVCVEVLKSNPL